MARIWQTSLIALARNRFLTQALQNNARLSRMAGQFVGGADEEAAVRTAMALRERGIRSSLFYLGEYITDPDVVERTIQSKIRIIGALHERGVEVHVSMDPTQIGYSIGDDLGRNNALRIGAGFPLPPAARSALMLDMEDAVLVDRTLELRRLLQGRGIPTAITLQSYLRRTEADLKALLGERVPSIRLVKGAFIETREIAWQQRSEIDAAYLRLASAMLSGEARDGGVFPVFATHDETMIRAILQMAGERGYAPDQFEFEMLYGVRPGLQARVLAGGNGLRLYVPFGTHWWPYTARRIGESPRSALFAWRALLGRAR